MFELLYQSDVKDVKGISHLSRAHTHTCTCMRAHAHNPETSLTSLTTYRDRTEQRFFRPLICPGVETGTLDILDAHEILCGTLVSFGIAIELWCVTERIYLFIEQLYNQCTSEIDGRNTRHKNNQNQRHQRHRIRTHTHGLGDRPKHDTRNRSHNRQTSRQKRASLRTLERSGSTTTRTSGTMTTEEKGRLSG